MKSTTPTTFKSRTDITEPLQERINQLSNAGGGEILIPAGEYTFRPIELKSNISLRLEAGAKLKASGKREDYFEIGYNHNEMGEVISCFYAFGQQNITLCGEGEIDLNHEAWYNTANRDTLPTVGPPVTKDYLDEGSRTREWRVNQPIFMHQCENIRVESLTVRNAPCWTFSFNECRIIKMLNLTILNGITIPNSDGMHFTCSSDILVSGCYIEAGDDCLALTCITNWSRPCENAVVTNCVFKSASKAISIGYQHSIVRNVLIENVIVKKSNRAFVIMCHPRTGLVENVRMSNCFLEGRSYGGEWWGNGESLVIMAIPHHIKRYRDPLPAPEHEISVRNVVFSNVTCRGERPIGVVASEAVTRNIRFQDCIMEIVPEEKPSLKGNVIDLAPGPENFRIPEGTRDIVCRNVDLSLDHVTDENGNEIGVREA